MGDGREVKKIESSGRAKRTNTEVSALRYQSLDILEMNMEKGIIKGMKRAGKEIKGGEDALMHQQAKGIATATRQQKGMK